MVKIKLDNNKKYVIKEFNFWVFHISIGYIGIKKVSITITLRWGW